MTVPESFANATSGPSCQVPEAAPTPGEPIDDETLAKVAKALGNPTRIKIIRLLLAQHTCMTGELVAQLPLAQSTISEHLRLLREAQLIQGEIEGPRTSYCVNQRILTAFKRAVADL
ncbi:MAG: ArsR/SmtB family transcription factor [Ferrimicrobium sp.]|jgi:ArsR family transcriptional regulator|uniref:Metalloregulator ArsR/SmtB family transcription factor n=1 Tax=Ferrimicrobium acidiphilum TaxID=121039 RepID=A0ABV3Y069_9ACTN|nr:metalloregulator ArsR/SmtB family transcription factor [Ferrimicrobium sp.]MCL5973350.1 metalloregulator ArsR/SmtB family transcription factor [Actinomycetota bacterium]